MNVHGFNIHGSSAQASFADMATATGGQKSGQMKIVQIGTGEEKFVTLDLAAVVLTVNPNESLFKSELHQDGHRSRLDTLS